ncbi:hypothetical protein [Rhizobium rhizogenes]|nr:hypothetical protein [Rhizobium rhizogenes]MDJ1636337.1 hypothetical protein [Rhizobium rhizogenes]WEO63836.1 hypothetical protein G6L54_012120 [Rhizobium rhizogenes]
MKNPPEIRLAAGGPVCGGGDDRSGLSLMRICAHGRAAEAARFAQ